MGCERYSVSYIASARGTTCAGGVPRLEEAHHLFCRFHQFPASRMIRVPCRRVIPPILVHLGRLRGLIYSSDRGSRGRASTYIHFMEEPPVLTCDPAGTQL